MSQTTGQYKVGSTFNPGGHSTVDGIKAAGAALIDAIESLQPSTDNEEQGKEVARLKAIAITQLEGALMFAVKAATKPVRQ